MKSKLFTRTLVVLAVAASASISLGATDSQGYAVVVAENISITAPSDVSINHDMTDANQVFPTQPWVVRGNTKDGVTVVFATNQPFTNANNAKRDAKLDLSVGATVGGASWVVTKATDTSDYAGGTPTASVQANSNGTGRATFNVGVTFITNVIDTVEAGTYVTTVTGTVTAN